MFCEQFFSECRIEVANIVSYEAVLVFCCMFLNQSITVAVPRQVVLHFVLISLLLLSIIVCRLVLISDFVGLMWLPVGLLEKLFLCSLSIIKKWFRPIFTILSSRCSCVALVYLCDFSEGFWSFFLVGFGYVLV